MSNKFNTINAEEEKITLEGAYKTFIKLPEDEYVY